MSKTERQSELLQRRRLRAGRLLRRGVAQAEVARRVSVTRTTVSQWNAQLQGGWVGRPEESTARPTRRAPGVATARIDACAQERRSGRGLCHGSVDTAAGRQVDSATLCPLIQPEPSLAHSRRARLLLPTIFRTGLGAQRGGHPALEADALAGSKKTPRNKAESSSSSTSRDSERAADPGA